MDSKLYYLFAVLVAAICISCTCAMSIPKDKAESLDEDNDVDPNERATWLTTREENEQQELMYLYSKLMQLQKGGFLAKGVLREGGSDVEKRGRWQGFCFRRTRSGRFLPYICWKGEARK